MHMQTFICRYVYVPRDYARLTNDESINRNICKFETNTNCKHTDSRHTNTHANISLQVVERCTLMLSKNQRTLLMGKASTASDKLLQMKPAEQSRVIRVSDFLLHSLPPATTFFWHELLQPEQEMADYKTKFVSHFPRPEQFFLLLFFQFKIIMSLVGVANNKKIIFFFFN